MMFFVLICSGKRDPNIFPHFSKPGTFGIFKNDDLILFCYVLRNARSLAFFTISDNSFVLLVLAWLI